MVLPPYSDHATGLFAAADWLDEHDFDYRGLRQVDALPSDGGLRVGLTSVLPTLLAMLFRSGMNQTGVHIVMHLANFALAAALVVSMFVMLRPVAGKWGSLALVGAMVTTPLFSVQVEMIGLDLPMATFAVAAALLSLRGRFGWAALASAASFAMKFAGLLGSIALWLYVAAVLAVALWARHPRAWWRDGLGFGLLTLSVAAQAVLYRWGTVGARSTDISNLRSGFDNFDGVLILCPDLLLLCLVLGASTAFVAVSGLVRGLRTQAVGEQPALRVVSFAIVKCPETLLGWLFVFGGAAAALFVEQLTAPRYFTVVVPFLYLIAGSVWFRDLRWRPWAVSCVVALTAVNLLNRSGMLFPAIAQRSHDGAALERSHEYLVDHSNTIRAMHEIAAKLQPDEALIAGAPFEFYLSLPRLGYVDTTVRGYAINSFAWGNWIAVEQLFKDHPRQLMFVVTDNLYYGLGQITIPYPDKSDPPEEILFDSRPQPPLVVYRRDLRSVASRVEDLETWYLDHLWYDQTPGHRHSRPLLARAGALFKGGFRLPALQLLRKGVANDPADPELQLELARQLIEAGQVEEGLAYAHEVAWADDTNAAPFDVLGLGRMQQNQIDWALSEFEEALDRDPGYEPARYHMAIAHLRKNDTVKAEAALRALLVRNPGHADARYQLGMIAALTGKFDEAVHEFDELLRREPERADAAVAAGVARLRQQRGDDAEQRFRDAITRQPDYAEAKNYLGLLLLGKSQLEPAERLFREAIAAQPKFAEPYNNLAVLLARTERFDQAELQLRAAIQLNRNYVEAYNNLGMVLARRERWSAARDCFVQALQIDPSHVGAQQNLQRVQERINGSIP